MEQSLDDATAARFAPFTREDVPHTTLPIGAGLEMMFAGPGSPVRADLEQFVVQAFEREHDAVVRTFMPVLVGCRDRERRLRSVVGLRAASAEPFFLERYLDRPAHELLADSSRRAVHRDGIVEVGNLAGLNCRAAVRLVASLPGLLLAMRFEWVVFTATTTVRQMLAAFGAPVIELARAGEACAAGGIDRWGRYYRNDPRVCAGWLPLARDIPAFAARTHGH
jgi:hypothetical protein